jgi:hypothetical protein
MLPDTPRSRASRSIALVGAGLIAGLVLSLVASSPAAAFQKTFTVDARELHLVDLLGQVKVEGYDGDKFQIEVDVQGDDATPENVQVTLDQDLFPVLRVMFPMEKRNRFVYPRMGGRSQTTFQLSGHHDRDDLLDEMLRDQGAREIRVSGGGSGLEIWADIHVRVPRDKRLYAYLGVGTLEADKVASSVAFRTHSGHMRFSDIEGNVRGDTGSGDVLAENVKGNISIDTGSGGVELASCDGQMVHVDTGSGRVRAREIRCEDLYIDTGSGGVEARDIRAGTASFDTGSGSITAEFLEMGDGRFLFDTGSGSIDLRLPENASADVMAETGNGRVHLDLVDEIDLRHRGPDGVAFRIGDGAAAIAMDTGSGSIRIAQ